MRVTVVHTTWAVTAATTRPVQARSHAKGTPSTTVATTRAGLIVAQVMIA